MKKLLLGTVFGAVSLFSTAAFAATPAPQQCVTNAVAGGTADAITVPLLPCGLATNILILTITANNTTTTPTLQMAGYPAVRIYTNTLQDPGIGDFGAAGSVLMLTSTGTSWLIINGNVGGYIPIPLDVANGGTGAATLTSHGVLYGNGTSAVGVTAAGTTGQVLTGSTGSAPSWASIASSLVSSLSFGSTGLLPSSATSGAVTVTGTLGFANGGTSNTSYTNGQLLIGNSGSGGLSKATLTAGSNVTITNSAGGITIASTGLASGCGTGVSPAGQVLTADGAGTCTANSGVTITGGTAFAVTGVQTQTGAFNLAGAASPLQVGGSAGTSGNVLTSAGAGATPTWTAVSSIYPAWAGAPKTTSFNAAVGTAYCIDTATTGAVTMTLPASPSDGDQIRFIDCKSNFASANFTVSRNGNKLMGLTADMTVNTNNAAATLIYSSTLTDWRMY